MPSSEIDQSVIASGVLADLPAPSDAVMPSMVINNPLVRVVYFNFDAGQGLSNHLSPRAFVLTVLSGALDFTMGDNTVRLDAGDVVYLPAERAHSLSAAERTQISVTMIAVDEDGNANPR